MKRVFAGDESPGGARFSRCAPTIRIDGGLAMFRTDDGAGG
ncbi:hypothetical protein [Streptomyces apricus]|nr:hypothetical protein [Streptomyces apricus]